MCQLKFERFVGKMGGNGVNLPQDEGVGAETVGKKGHPAFEHLLLLEMCEQFGGMMLDHDTLARQVLDIRDPCPA